MKKTEDLIPITIRTRIWIDINGKPFLGKGRVRLLEEVNRTGSITAAAKVLQMSYRQAWEHIKNMNKISRTPIVIAATGGKNGGGASLTEQGLKAIKQYYQLEREIFGFTNEHQFVV